MGRLRWLMVVAAALGAGACASENRRAITQERRTGIAPALLGDEAEAEVREKWGPPDRTMTLVDEKTGRSEQVWQYDRFVDANGSKVTTTVTFGGGRVKRIERMPVPRPVPLPPDSAARRDMDY